MLLTDQQITNRLTALSDSTTQGLPLVTTPDFHAALAAGGKLCVAARTGLESASQTMESDKRENAAAAAAHADSISTAVDELGVLGANVRNRLLNLRASERVKLGSAELSRRTTWLRDAFDTAPSRIESLGRTVAKDKLREALSTLESSTFVSSDELGPLRAAVTAVEETHATVVAETLDDAGILDALVRARTKAQRVAVSQRQLIVAILGFEDLPITVDDFVLRTPTRATAQAPEAPEAPAEPQPEAETQEPEPVLPS